MRVTLVRLDDPIECYRVTVAGESIGLIERRPYGWHTLTLEAEHGTAEGPAEAVAALWRDRVAARRRRQLAEFGLVRWQLERDVARVSRDAYATALKAEHDVTTEPRKARR